MRKIKSDKLFVLSFLLFFVSYIVYQYYKAPKFVVISEILRNPDKYHRKEVLVKGKIVDAKYKESEWGPEYAVYVLSDGTGVIKVFADGYNDPEMCDWGVGAKIEVLGKYYKVKRVGPYVFFNQIDAESISLESEEAKKFQELLEKEYNCRKDCEKYADPESCKEFCKNKVYKIEAPKVEAPAPLDR
jgi:RPA family protein